MIECETKIDSKVQKAILKKSLITSLVFLIVGAVGTVAYLVLVSIFDYSWLDALLIFAFFFGFGFIFYITLNKTVKDAEKSPFTNKYQFNDDELTITTTKGETVVSTATTKYSMFYKIKENKDFLLIYPSKNAVYPILKSSLDEQDLTKLREILKLDTTTTKN